MKSKRSLKLWSMLLALAMCLSIFPCSAFAAETSSSEQVSAKVQSIEDAGISRETAMEVLGLTAEEAKDVDYYVISPMSHVSIGSGEVHEFPKFSFTGDNVGSYFTVNGSKLKVAMIWHPLFSDSVPGIFRAYLYPYGSTNPIHQTFFTTEREPNGANNTWLSQSEWLNVTRGLDYHFIYSCWRPDISVQLRCEVTVIVGVV